MMLKTSKQLKNNLNFRKMKTKHILLAAMVLFSSAGLFAQEIKVNTANSQVNWVGKKKKSQHEGTIQLKSGDFEIIDNKIVAGNFVMDMNTILNTDIDSEKSKKKIEDHLKNEDFFDVEEFPTATFVVTGGTSFKNDKATLTGDLTIKGITEPVSFEVERKGSGYAAQIDVDRSKYNVRYKSDSFFNNLGDSAIADVFSLIVKLEI